LAAWPYGLTTLAGVASPVISLSDGYRKYSCCLMDSVPPTVVRAVITVVTQVAKFSPYCSLNVAKPFAPVVTEAGVTTTGKPGSRRPLPLLSSLVGVRSRIPLRFVSSLGQVVATVCAHPSVPLAYEPLA